MSNEHAKVWKPGCADEVWKVLVCAQEVRLASETISGLCYILTAAGSDEAAALAKIKGMSGAQIVDALKAFRETARKSVETALSRKQ